MSHDPYSSPGSRLTSFGRRPAPVKAVVVGMIVDVGGSVLFGIVFGFAYAMVLSAGGLPQADVVATLNNLDPRTVAGFIPSLAGLLFSFLGGYVCARIAVERIYTCASVMALLETALSITSVNDDRFAGGLMILLMIIAIFLGAYAQKKTLRDKKREPDAQVR